MQLISGRLSNISRGISKMVGPKKQDFWTRVNKVDQKLKLENNVIYKIWTPKLVFLYEKKKNQKYSIDF